jgi:hypothetical protein
MKQTKIKQRSRPDKKTARRRSASNKKITIIPPRTVAKLSLTRLAKQINAEHLKIIGALRSGVNHGIKAGSLLIAVKETKLKHGEFLPWVRTNCRISERTAQLYMSLARHASEIEANTKSIADLTISGAIALIANADERDPAAGIAIDQEQIVTSSTEAPARPLKVEVTKQTIAIPAVGYMHQDAPAPDMTDDERWRLNLNQAGHFLLHIPHTPITAYLHPDVDYSADQWDDIGDFLKRLAAAMRNAVGAFDQTTTKEQINGPVGG